MFASYDVSKYSLLFVVSKRLRSFIMGLEHVHYHAVDIMCA